MHDLQSLLAFSETAKRQGFAAAARELGTAPSTIAKSVSRLERSLGLRLFHRTTRQVSLTQDGERLFERCQRVLAEVEALKSEASGAHARPAGTLRIDMPIVFGRKVMLPLLARIIEQHPELALDVRLSDGYVDLVKDGIDVAIRVGTLDDSSLVARRFATQEMVLCASPGYLARLGRPRRIEELSRHHAILFRLPTSGRDRPWQLSANGRTVTLHPQARCRFNDGEAMVAAANMGMGIVQIPEVYVSEELAGGTLVELLPRCRPPAAPIHAVIPANRLVPARVRVLLDALPRAAGPTQRVPRKRQTAR